MEERPGMCCALYNLCCFRETFRISSSKSYQEPIHFPIVHRFQVQQSSVIAARPQPRQQVTSSQDQDQDSFTPRRPNLSRPQSGKKSFTPSRPEGFKKLPNDDGDNVEDSKKSRSRPKFSGLLGNRNAEERRKLNNEESGNPSQLKATRRPVGSDIRQEVHVAEATNAAGIGARRLDASINPVVTRKRLLVGSESRRAPRVEVKEEPQPEGRGPRGRNLQSSPAREGRKISGGRGSNRSSPPPSPSPPPPQQSSRRAQPTATPILDNSRAKIRPVIAIPTAPPLPPVPVTPKEAVTEKPSEAPMVKESESPAAVEEADGEIQSIIEALQSTQDIPEPNTAPDTPQPSPAEESPAAEPSQPEEAIEKKVETPSEPMEETETEVKAEVKTEAESVKTAANTAFTPPEIVVNTPKEPKVEEPTRKPQQERTTSSRSSGSGRGAVKEVSRGQSRTTTRPTEDRETSRSGSRRTGQEGARETTNTDRSRTTSRSTRG